MKQIIYLLFMALVCLPTLRAADIADPVKDGPKFTVSVEIGRPPSCIIWWSVCSITFGGIQLSQGPSGTIEKTSGGGSGGGGGSSWMLSLSRESFAKHYPDFLSKLDGQNTVIFDGTYVLPSEFRERLGCEEDLMIRGNTPYPVRYENGYFIINFP